MAAGRFMDDVMNMTKPMPPSVINAPELEPERPLPSAGQEQWTIFLVEDDYDDMQLALRILKNSPRVHKIIWVSDAISLFKELDAHNFYQDGLVRQRGLIMLDIHIPGMDGLSLLEQLRSNPFTQSLPIVMITGDVAQKKLHQSYMLNANAYLSKPFNDDHLGSLHAVFDKGNGWNESSH